jgi:fructose-1,6-bisphosphatase I
MFLFKFHDENWQIFTKFTTNQKQKSCLSKHSAHWANLSSKNKKILNIHLENYQDLISAIRLASKVVNREVNKAGIANIIGQVGNQNIQGEDQQKLDVLPIIFLLKLFLSVKLFAELPPKKVMIL